MVRALRICRALRLNKITILFPALMLMVLALPARADRDQSCTLKGGNQRAEYHCPVGFDAIVAGEGTDRCDGSCYAKGDRKALSGALTDLFASRYGMHASGESTITLSQQLEKYGSVRFHAGESIPGGFHLDQEVSFKIRPNEPK